VIANGAGASDAQALWQPEGIVLKLVLAPSTDSDPPLSPLRTYDNIAGINDTAVTQDQWVNGPTPTYVSATSFTLVGDQTSTFHIGRRIKTSNTGGTVYSTISDSAYTSLTTITVVNDSGVLDSGLSEVDYSLLSAINDAVPRDQQLKAESITHEMTSDADYTLTDYENLSGRYIITDTVVTLTVARNIIVSIDERSFIAQNDTAETLTFKTSAGTGIDVLAGNTDTLYCDGTDVIVSGNPRLIASEEVTGSAQTTIDFPVLDLNAHGGRYNIEIDFVEGAGLVTAINLYVNNDTTDANYYVQQISVNDTTVTGSRSNLPSFVQSAANNEVFANGYIGLANGYPNALVSYASGSASNVLLIDRVIKKTGTVSNITQLTFTATQTDGLGVGTTIKIYRTDR
jgi:hypothetical protein